MPFGAFRVLLANISVAFEQPTASAALGAVGPWMLQLKHCANQACCTHTATILLPRAS